MECPEIGRLGQKQARKRFFSESTTYIGTKRRRLIDANVNHLRLLRHRWDRLFAELRILRSGRNMLDEAAQTNILHDGRQCGVGFHLKLFPSSDYGIFDAEWSCPSLNQRDETKLNTAATSGSNSIVHEKTSETSRLNCQGAGHRTFKFRESVVKCSLGKYLHDSRLENTSSSCVVNTGNCAKRACEQLKDLSDDLGAGASSDVATLCDGLPPASIRRRSTRNCVQTSQVRSNEISIRENSVSDIDSAKKLSKNDNRRSSAGSPSSPLIDAAVDISSPSLSRLSSRRQSDDTINGDGSLSEDTQLGADGDKSVTKVTSSPKLSSLKRRKISEVNNVDDPSELSDTEVLALNAVHASKRVGRPTTKEKIIERARHEAETMRRVKLLRKQGLWSDHPLSKTSEPKRDKSHWDYLIEEVIWLSNDFATESKWKRVNARKVGRMVLKYHQDKASQDERASKDLERDLRRIASFVAREIRTFWLNIEKVVEFKMNSHLEEKRKRALDQHLNFIVDQTEKYSERLTEALKPEIDKQPSSAETSEKNSVAAGQSDGEFEPDSASDDDELTIAVAEKDQLVSDTTAEVEALQKESALSMEDILDTLPPGYLENFTAGSAEASLSPNDSVNDSDTDSDSSDGADDEGEADESLNTENMDETCEISQRESLSSVTESSNTMATTAEDNCIAEPGGSVSSSTNVALQQETKETKQEADEVDAGLKALLNVDDDGVGTDDALDGNQISDVAAMAQSFQPKGYTLSSTIVKTPVPFLLKHTLREYQHVGLEWLATMYEKNLNGILADEMGLGKTIQTIALLAHLACVKANWGPHLIVVPTSVMLNWEMEFKKWCPAFKILVYYGAIKERRLKRIGWTKENAFHVCITSYKLVVQDHAAFRRKEWEYLILDEAHNIKNFKSQRWQLLLNFNSQSRLLLTGTPLQNNLMELWSLMHFLMPHVFASHREFKEWFASPLTGMVEGSSEYNDKIIKRLHKVLRPFLLRRLKSEVEKQMPKKFEHVVPCRLSKRQRYLYDEFLGRSKTQKTLAAGNFLSVIDILMQLRKVCNHPDMFEPRPIIAPLLVDPLLYHTASLAWSPLIYRPLVDVSLDILNLHLLDLELQLTAFAAHRIRRFQAQRRFIEEVDRLPPPPPRCPAGRIKLHVRANTQPPTAVQPAVVRAAVAPSVRAPTPASISGTGTVRPPSVVRPAQQQSAPPGVSATAGASGYTLQLLHGGVLRTVQLSALGAAAAPLALALQRAGVRPNTPAASQQQPGAAAVAGARLPAAQPRLNLVTSSPATNMIRLKSIISQTAAAPGSSPKLQLMMSPQKSVCVGQKSGTMSVVSTAPSSALASSTTTAASTISSMKSPGSVAKITSGAPLTPAMFQFSNNSTVFSKSGGSVLQCSSVVNGCVTTQQSARPQSHCGATHTPVTTSTANVADTSTQATCSSEADAERSALLARLELPRLTEARQQRRREQLAIIQRINQRRCEACPVYGADLIRAATFAQCRPAVLFAVRWNRGMLGDSQQQRRSRRARHAGSVTELSADLAALVRPTLEHRLLQLRPVFARFLLYVPRAAARPPRLHVSHPPPWRDTQLRRARAQLASHVAPLLRPLHCVERARHALFPERRLIQYDCGKLQVLDRLLHELRCDGHRVLIFTQMTRMLDILEQFLNFHGHIYLRLDGTTHVEQRQALMERFNADRRIFCFILSTRSGGIGVNLTGADTVIFYDSDWNPTMDAQAQDRCHRIGQTRDVHIYRLVSAQTIEENILKKANQKRMLGDLAIEGGNFTASFFKQRTLHTLFEQATPDADAEAAGGDDSVNAGELAEYERALATVEDGRDAEAARDARAEVQAELSEFDEPSADGASRPSRAEQEVGRLLEQLSSVERWAVDFIERTDDVLRREGARATAQLAAQEREWEASQRLVLQQRDHRRPTVPPVSTKCQVVLQKMLDSSTAASNHS